MAQAPSRVGRPAQVEARREGFQIQCGRLGGRDGILVGKKRTWDSDSTMVPVVDVRASYASNRASLCPENKRKNFISGGSKILRGSFASQDLAKLDCGERLRDDSNGLEKVIWKKLGTRTFMARTRVERAHNWHTSRGRPGLIWSGQERRTRRGEINVEAKSFWKKDRMITATYGLSSSRTSSLMCPGGASYASNLTSLCQKERNEEAQWVEPSLFLESLAKPDIWILACPSRERFKFGECRLDGTLLGKSELGIDLGLYVTWPELESNELRTLGVQAFKSAQVVHKWVEPSSVVLYVQHITAVNGKLRSGLSELKRGDSEV
ncbi:hypothetical protein C8R47DRAFT_1062469 [Mycena vitilis]|nr:hypothetical protein C8R47DRAFT_1062469 [Mycena vitilis]